MSLRFRGNTKETPYHICGGGKKKFGVVGNSAVSWLQYQKPSIGVAGMQGKAGMARNRHDTNHALLSMTEQHYSSHTACVTAGISWRLNQLLPEFPPFCPHLCPISSTSTNIHLSVLVFRASSRNVRPTSRCRPRRTVVMERPRTPVVKL